MLQLPPNDTAIIAEAFISSANKYDSGVKMSTLRRENMSIFQMKNYLLNQKKRRIQIFWDLQPLKNPYLTLYYY